MNIAATSSKKKFLISYSSEVLLIFLALPNSNSSSVHPISTGKAALVDLSLNDLSKEHELDADIRKKNFI